jgi:hypothetical protein
VRRLLLAAAALALAPTHRRARAGPPGRRDRPRCRAAAGAGWSPSAGGSTCASARGRPGSCCSGGPARLGDRAAAAGRGARAGVATSVSPGAAHGRPTACPRRSRGARAAGAPARAAARCGRRRQPRATAPGSRSPASARRGPGAPWAPSCAPPTSRSRTSSARSRCGARRGPSSTRSAPGRRPSRGRRDGRRARRRQPREQSLGGLRPPALLRRPAHAALGGDRRGRCGRERGAGLRPVVVERLGLRVAFVGFSRILPFEFRAGPRTPGTAWAFEDRVRAGVRAARRRADVVVAAFHWGDERATRENATQRALARWRSAAAPRGARRPPARPAADRRVGRRKLVAYSLGTSSSARAPRGPRPRRSCSSAWVRTASAASGAARRGSSADAPCCGAS